MGGAGERETRVLPLPEPEPDHPEMSSLPIPDELLGEIFLRLPTHADLVRASAACVSFRRVATGRSFLRRYRKTHAPPLIGFVSGLLNFYPAERPHPSARVARAVARAGDFTFSFLPAPTPSRHWAVQDVSDGRVLVGCCDLESQTDVTEMVICDPLHRRYLVLPPIPDDLASAVDSPRQRGCEAFLLPSNCGEEEEEEEETSFRVIWMVQCATNLVAFVFSSCTRQWQAVPSRSFTGLIDGLPTTTWMPIFTRRQYAHGCFYWVTNWSEKLLVLDARRMEFSMADRPAGVGCSRLVEIAIMEAGEGITAMFELERDSPHIYYLSYILGRNNGGSPSQWTQKQTILSLGSGSTFVGSAGRHLFIEHNGATGQLFDAGCFARGMKTFQLQRLCVSENSISQPRAYSNFPPSLSSPRLSTGNVLLHPSPPLLHQYHTFCLMVGSSLL
ncbi:hypothetical protein BRADI_3g01427v3 [Brachypodium distachyon]|uniref:F-box domain-containing protein n=1 Tax=Brachypodium distachyon TaxID=15368 RepID=A0A2K2CUL6_BRADI|nr:hypothetical protein BRADI_3g01427v3 [Brachypodium distachyon]